MEPYGGAGSVLMQKARCFCEVYNDVDGAVVTLFKILRDPELSKKLVDNVVMTPYSREEFNQAKEPTDDPLETARRVLVRAAMGFGSTGATKDTTGFRIDSARKFATAAHTWRDYPKNIELFCRRLQGVIIENRDALRVIDDHDRPDTLFYVDPPYMPETRSKGGRGYKHELTEDDHQTLLEKILELEGMVVMSGYRCPLYDDFLKGWERHSKNSRVASNRGTRVATENIWLNPACSSRKPQVAMNF